MTFRGAGRQVLAPSTELGEPFSWSSQEEQDALRACGAIHSDPTKKCSVFLQLTLWRSGREAVGEVDASQPMWNDWFELEFAWADEVSSACEHTDEIKEVDL